MRIFLGQERISFLCMAFCVKISFYVIKEWYLYKIYLTKIDARKQI